MSFKAIPTWEENFFASRQAKQQPTVPTPPDGTHLSVIATVREKQVIGCCPSCGEKIRCFLKDGNPIVLRG